MSRFRFSAKRSLGYIIVGGWSLFSIALVLWVVLASLKTTRALFGSPWSLTTSPLFSTYAKVWVANRFGDYFLNSILVVSVSVALLLVVAVPAAYVLSRGQFFGRRAILNFFIFGMGIPIPLLFIPLVVLTTELRMIDTLTGLIAIYVSISLPFTIYVLQGFFSSLPSDLQSAAIIDGCSDWQVFWHVMLPLAAPGAATVAVLNFVALWNEYQLSLVLINSPENRTLSLGIYSLISSMQYSGGNWPGLFAGVAIVMLPTLAIYMFLSERMISGITMGGVK
jgi:ABC-type glycerol-3-phosphate transport system permease component